MKPSIIGSLCSCTRSTTYVVGDAQKEELRNLGEYREERNTQGSLGTRDVVLDPEDPQNVSALMHGIRITTEYLKETLSVERDSEEERVERLRLAEYQAKVFLREKEERHEGLLTTERRVLRRATSMVRRFGDSAVKLWFSLKTMPNLTFQLLKDHLSSKQQAILNRFMTEQNMDEETFMTQVFSEEQFQKLEQPIKDLFLALAKLHKIEPGRTSWFSTVNDVRESYVQRGEKAIDFTVHDDLQPFLTLPADQITEEMSADDITKLGKLRLRIACELAGLSFEELNKKGLVKSTQKKLEKGFEILNELQGSIYHVYEAMKNTLIDRDRRREIGKGANKLIRRALLNPDIRTAVNLGDSLLSLPAECISIVVGAARKVKKSIRKRLPYTLSHWLRRPEPHIDITVSDDGAGEGDPENAGAGIGDDAETYAPTMFDPHHSDSEDDVIMDE